MRRRVVLSLLGLTLLALLPSACGDVVLEPGDNCNDEGWFGPRRTCPPGYICDNKADWRCVRSGGYPSWPAPPIGDAPEEDAALDVGDSAAPDAEDDAAPDARDGEAPDADEPDA